MSRLYLVNSTLDVPIHVFKDKREDDGYFERAFRLELLQHRAIESRHRDGTPPYFYRWINIREYGKHYDKPDIAAYVGLKTIMEFGSYELIRFHNPSLHLLKLKPSPRLCAEPKGSRSSEVRKFSYTFLDFLNTVEISSLQVLVDRALDEYARRVDSGRSIDLCCTTDESEDESDYPSSPTGSVTHDEDIDWNQPSVGKWCAWSPPRDPRLRDHEPFFSSNPEVSSDDDVMEVEPPPKEFVLIDLSQDNT